MKNGKYCKKRSLLWRKQFVLLVSVAVLLLGVMGGSLAYLFTNTEPVVNTFAPAEVPPSIDETKPEDNGNVKENVKVTNQGNIPAYIRAAVVINWVDAQGNIVVSPEGHDYKIVYAENTGWIKDDDGFWYYKGAVAPGTGTGILIKEAYPTEGDVYQLKIDILAESIQAEPAAAVQEAWGTAAAALVGAVSAS